MAKTFRSKSNILKLPSEIVQEIDRMLVEVGEGRKIYEEIVAWVEEQGHSTSTSALSRYYKYIQALERVKIMSQQVKAILDETDKDSPLELEEGVSKLAATVIMEVLQEATKDGKPDVKYIGRLLGDFAKLQRSDVARERLKMDFRKKADKFIKDAEGKSKEMSKEELLDFIKGRVYGLA